MKRIFLSALVISSLLTSCFKDDDTPIVVETSTTNIYNNTTGGTDTCTEETVTGILSEDTTWSSDICYILDGKVVVPDGITLTIDPGTVIKAKAGTGELASALIVARGGIINAAGTASEPIIFTSTSDDIMPGEIAGTTLNENDRGRWGGVLILGYAPCSFSGDVSELQIEGIPASETYGLYGGTDEEDNSGVFQYVSIRHGGALIGEGNEINGLTLGGVGNGTVIDHVEVVGNVDDGIEFFGGTVNVSDVIIWAQGDDALDIDQAYAGTIDNAVVVLGEASDHAFEIDGPEGSATGSFTLQNVSIKGNADLGANSEYADYRSNAMGHTNNIYAFGFSDSADIELDNAGVADNYTNGILTFDSWEIALPSGVTDVLDIFNDTTGTTTGFGSEATAVSTGEQTVGASITEFSWTYTRELGGLNGF